MKIKLPAIAESAKNRPLSFNPKTNSFIYYDDVENSKSKIFPIEKLNEEQLNNLVIERQLSNGPSTTAVLNENMYSNEEVANLIKQRSKSKLGKQLYNADLDYLKFYLAQFPESCFEK